MATVRHAGRIIGLPDSQIKRLTLEDGTLITETDLVIQDAEQPILNRVDRTIKAGVALAKILGEY